jgi:hypothetical protein
MRAVCAANVLVSDCARGRTLLYSSYIHMQFLGRIATSLAWLVASMFGHAHLQADSLSTSGFSYGPIYLQSTNYDNKYGVYLCETPTTDCPPPLDSDLTYQGCSPNSGNCMYYNASPGTYCRTDNDCNQFPATTDPSCRGTAKCVITDFNIGGIPSQEVEYCQYKTKDSTTQCQGGLGNCAADGSCKDCGDQVSDGNGGCKDQACFPACDGNTQDCVKGQCQNKPACPVSGQTRVDDVCACPDNSPDIIDDGNGGQKCGVDLCRQNGTTCPADPTTCTPAGTCTPSTGQCSKEKPSCDSNGETPQCNGDGTCVCTDSSCPTNEYCDNVECVPKQCADPQFTGWPTCDICAVDNQPYWAHKDDKCDSPLNDDCGDSHASPPACDTCPDGYSSPKDHENSDCNDDLKQCENNASNYPSCTECVDGTSPQRPRRVGDDEHIYWRNVRGLQSAIKSKQEPLFRW